MLPKCLFKVCLLYFFCLYVVARLFLMVARVFCIIVRRLVTDLIFMKINSCFFLHRVFSTFPFGVIGFTSLRGLTLGLGLGYDLDLDFDDDSGSS